MAENKPEDKKEEDGQNSFARPQSVAMKVHLSQLQRKKRKAAEEA